MYWKKPAADAEAPEAPEPDDMLSQEGARNLKRRIEGEWRERGRVIHLRVVGYTRSDGLGVVFGLEGDAVNGTPPAAQA